MTGLNVITTVLLAGAVAASNKPATSPIPSSMIEVAKGPTAPSQKFYDPMWTGPNRWIYDPMTIGTRQRIHDPMPIWPGMMNLHTKKITKVPVIQADVK